MDVLEREGGTEGGRESEREKIWAWFCILVRNDIQLHSKNSFIKKISP